MISSTSGGQDLLKGAPLLKGAGLLAILAFPLLGFSDYVLHIAISILIWGFIYTGWSVMGRFGLVSLGHGSFLGVGSYGTTLLSNHLGLTPCPGIPAAVAEIGRAHV